MVHSNYTPIGRKTPDFPGGIIPNHSVNGAVEWAYGVADWFEQGLYFPVYTAYSEGRGGSLNGFKIRELFVRPHAHDHTFFLRRQFRVQRQLQVLGVQSALPPRFGPSWDCTCIRWTSSSIRLWIPTTPGGFGGLEFVPATRIAYNFNDKWAVAVEEYADDGPLRHFLPLNDQFHEVWAVMDRSSKILSIETGVGFGSDLRGRQIDVQADAVARPQLNI